MGRSTPPQIDAIFKRIDRADGHQDKFSPCVICGQNFVYCKHSKVQVDTIISAWQMMNTLGRKREG